MNNEYVSSEVVEENSFESDAGSNGPCPAVSPAPVDILEGKISLEWVMAKMEAIIHDNAHIAEAIKSITEMCPVGNHDHATQFKASSIADVVKAREATNHIMLKFLEKVYDDLKPAVRDSVPLLAHLDLAVLAENLQSEHVVEIIRAITG